MKDYEYTTNEVAEELGVSPRTVNVWVNRGYLKPAGKRGRQNTFRLADVFEAERCNRWRTPALAAALDSEQREKAHDRLSRILAGEAFKPNGAHCQAPGNIPVPAVDVRARRLVDAEHISRCGMPVPKDTPAPLCVQHLAATYLHVRDILDAARMTTAGGQPTPASVVYFIQRGDLIKIGYTTNLTARLRALQGDRILLALPGTRAHESALHELFKAHREKGEWFRRTPEILEFICDRADQNVAT